jgi:hypothetical protein
MFTPNKSLIETVQAHRNELLLHICNRLQNLSNSHYEMIDFEVHKKRENDILEALLTSFSEENESIFVEHIERIAIARSEEDYSLNEVQDAMRIFEEELLLLLIEHQPVQKQLIDMLLSCHHLFGKARDDLALVYYDKCMERQKQLDDLRERFYSYRHESKDTTEASGND